MKRVLDPDVVIAELKAGNERFLEGKSQQSSFSSLVKLKEFANKGPLPKAIVLASASHLSISSRLIENLVHEEKIKIASAVLDLKNGRVDFLEI